MVGLFPLEDSLDSQTHDRDFAKQNTVVVGSVETNHAQKLASSMICRRSETKWSAPTGLLFSC